MAIGNSRKVHRLIGKSSVCEVVKESESALVHFKDRLLAC